VLAPKRPVHYGGLYPQESREIFVRQGIGHRARLNTQRKRSCRATLRRLAQAREEEAKLRRAGLVADEDWQARWYLDRIPVEAQYRHRARQVVSPAWLPPRNARLQWSILRAVAG
jgi:ATP-dependent helicase HrpA